MNRLVTLALKQRILVMGLLGMLLVGGVVAFINLNIEAYPDPVPPLVDIVTQSNGQSAEEVERYITIPLEVADGGHSSCHGHPHRLAVRPVGCKAAIHL